MSGTDHVALAQSIRANVLKRIKPEAWKRAVVGDHIMWTHQEAGRTLVRVQGEVPTDDIPQDPNELVKYHLVKRAEAFDLLLGRHDDLAHVGKSLDDFNFVGKCLKAYKYVKAHHKSIFSGGEEEYETGDQTRLPPLPNHEDEMKRVKLIYQPDSDTRRVTRRGTKGNGVPGDTPTLTGKRGRSGHPATPDEPESQSKKQSRERQRSPSPPVALVTGDKSLHVVDALVSAVTSDPEQPNAPASDNFLFESAINNFVSTDQLMLEVAELKRKNEINDQLKLEVVELKNTVSELVEFVEKLKEQQEGGNLPAPPTGVSPAAGVAIGASNMPEFLVKALEKQNAEGKPMKYQSGQSSVNGVRIAVNFNNSVGTSLYLNIQEKLGSDGRCLLNYAIFKNEEEQVELRVDKKKLQWSYKLNLAATKFDILRDILAGKLYDFHVDKLKKSIPRDNSVPPVVTNNDAVPTPRTKKILTHLGRMLGVSTGTPVGPSPLRPNEERSKNMPPPPTRTQPIGVRRSPRGHPQVEASEFGGFVSQTVSPYANTRRRASIGGTPGVFTFMR